MHPDLLEALSGEHRDRLLTEADARRARRSAARDAKPLFGPSALTVRPIACDDTDRISRMCARMSAQSMRLRFFAPVRRLSPDQLDRFVDVDHDTRDALVAARDDEIVAVASYAARSGTHEAVLGFVVEDAWQHCGIGTRLARGLTELAVARGFDTFVATIMPENRAALGLLRKLAPHAAVRWSYGEYEAAIPLAPR
jgi:ribosomal protein S18 acetylase RimI-like enzyme